MRHRARRLALTLAGTGLALALAGCGSDSPTPTSDHPRNERTDAHAVLTAAQKKMFAQSSYRTVQLALAGVQKAGTVSVTAPTKVKWSMTIGRGEPPEEAD
ncbi:hypothetical protein C1N81_44960 (plasmid) [Streptomyces sp. SGAir0957]